MNPLYLHVGMGKTATTTLQRAVFSRHPEICYLGKDDFYRRRISKNGKGYRSEALARAFGPVLRGAHLNALSIEQRIMSQLPFLQTTQVSKAADILAKHEKEHSDTKITLGSWEGLCGCDHQRFERMIARLQKVRTDTRLLFTVRDPSQYVKSSYLQTVKQTGRQGLPFINFEAWFKQKRKLWAASIPRHYKNMEIAHQLLPRQAVHIVPFELIKKEPDEFFTAIAQALGISAEKAIELSRKAHENKTLTQAQLEFLKSDQAAHAPKKERRELFNQLVNQGGKAEVQVPKAILSAIIEEAAPVNQWLTDVTQLDLAALGYSGID